MLLFPMYIWSISAWASNQLWLSLRRPTPHGRWYRSGPGERAESNCAADQTLVLDYFAAFCWKSFRRQSPQLQIVTSCSLKLHLGFQQTQLGLDCPEVSRICDMAADNWCDGISDIDPSAQIAHCPFSSRSTPPPAMDFVILKVRQKSKINSQNYSIDQCA